MWWVPGESWTENRFECCGERFKRNFGVRVDRWSARIGVAGISVGGTFIGDGAHTIQGGVANHVDPHIKHAAPRGVLIKPLIQIFVTFTTDGVLRVLRNTFSPGPLAPRDVAWAIGRSMEPTSRGRRRDRPNFSVNVTAPPRASRSQIRRFSAPSRRAAVLR